MKSTRQLEYMSMYIRIFQKVIMKRAGYQDYQTRRLSWNDSLYDESYRLTMSYMANRDAGKSVIQSFSKGMQS